jgi:hypothetical protein
MARRLKSNVDVILGGITQSPCASFRLLTLLRRYHSPADEGQKFGCCRESRSCSKL